MAFSLRRFLAIGKLSYVVGDRISGGPSKQTALRA